ncbi:hypothetical protein J4441_00435 [Candidatus Micrarchaeota archaeon]|nr:hypothetical protein [Candidatus Micrarchaeota archaeon]
MSRALAPAVGIGAGAPANALQAGGLQALQAARVQAFFAARVPFLLAAYAVATRLQSNTLPAFSRAVPKVIGRIRRENVTWEEYKPAYCEEGRCVVWAGWADGHEAAGANVHRLNFVNGGFVKNPYGNYAMRKVRDPNVAAGIIGSEPPAGVAKIALLAKLENRDVYALFEVGRREPLRDGGMADESALSLARVFAAAHAKGELTGGAARARDIYVNEASAMLVSAYAQGENWEDGINEFCISVAYLLKGGALNEEQAGKMVREYVAHSPIVRALLSEQIPGEKTEAFVHELAGGKGRILRSGGRGLKVAVRRAYSLRLMKRVLRYLQML